MSTIAITTIEHEVAAEQTILRSADTHLHRAAEMRLEKLEKQLANAKDDAARLRASESQREADAARREQADREELEAKLMAGYISAAPGTSEAEARAALPDLLHRHRLGQLADRDALIQRARATKYRI